MFKFDQINLGGPTPNIQNVICEINTTEKCVTLPEYYHDGYENNIVRYVGFKEIPTVDMRCDYEKWKDEYFYNYYPTPEIIEVEVPVSKSVKKICIPRGIEKISKTAFKNLTDVEFEIDKDNYNYKVENGKIIPKHTGEIIWPYNE